MHKGCKVRIIDNSGGKEGEIIGILGDPRVRILKVGQVVTVVVKANDPASVKVNRKSAAKSIFAALIVTARLRSRERVGFTRCNENSVILLGKNVKKTHLVPIGTEVLYPIDTSVFSVLSKCRGIDAGAVTKVLLTASSHMSSVKVVNTDENAAGVKNEV